MNVGLELKPADRLMLSQAEAAAYIGVSLGLFLSAVKKGDLPQPKALGRRKLWLRADIERAFGLTTGAVNVQADPPKKRRVFA
jgi:predicted DNA-binding transcriptional regulator AlpA